MNTRMTRTEHQRSEYTQQNLFCCSAYQISFYIYRRWLNARSFNTYISWSVCFCSYCHWIDATGAYYLPFLCFYFHVCFYFPLRPVRWCHVIAIFSVRPHVGNIATIIDSVSAILPQINIKNNFYTNWILQNTFTVIHLPSRRPSPFFHSNIHCSSFPGINSIQWLIFIYFMHHLVNDSSFVLIRHCVTSSMCKEWIQDWAICTCEMFELLFIPSTLHIFLVSKLWKETFNGNEFTEIHWAFD